MQNDPEGIQEVKLDQIFDLTDANNVEHPAFEIPTGAIIRYAGLIVKADVIPISRRLTTTTRLGLKTETAPPIGATPGLTRNSKFSGFMPSTVVQQTTKILICALQDDGLSFGDNYIVAGQVRVVVAYFVLNPLRDF
jgi:hypothetical protein